MKKQLAVTLGLIVAGAIGVYAFQSTPTVTLVPATPSTISVDSTTTITITAQITDARVITTGVNLLQVDPNTGAQTTVGLLASQGGGVFSIEIQPTTTVPELFTYEVSAAFRGLLKRSLSLPITVVVVPAGVVVPPDPGPAGTQTLAGIDSDKDGVRDDVQRWIAVTFSGSAKLRAGATQFAQSLQLLITGPTNSQTVLSNAQNEIKAAECLNYIDFSLHGGIVPSSQSTYNKVLAEQLNTSARAQAYYAADQQLSGSFFGGPPAGQYSSQCNFNPATLPN
jgi:hypothetical protein